MDSLAEFAHDAVHPPAPTVHGDLYTGVLWDLGESQVGELAVLIRIEDLRLAMARQHVLKGLDAEVALHGVGEPPGQHLAAPPIHDDHQVEKAKARRAWRPRLGPLGWVVLAA